MSEKTLAEKVLSKMFDNDPYSQWMDMDVLSIESGMCSIKMKIRGEMLNGFGIAHGSITYALADSALAFASNSHGSKCVSIDTQISHLYPCKEGDVITAEAKEVNRSLNLGHYEVEVKNQEKKLVAHFKGTVYNKGELWFPENE